MSDDQPATREDFEALAAEIRGLTRVVADAVRAMPPKPTERVGGNATIHVNMGGWGLAIAVCAALFCLILVVDLRSDLRDTNRQVERNQDYTNMLWQRYPELRPKNLEKKP